MIVLRQVSVKGISGFHINYYKDINFNDLGVLSSLLYTKCKEVDIIILKQVSSSMNIKGRTRRWTHYIFIILIVNQGKFPIQKRRKKAIMVFPRFVYQKSFFFFFHDRNYYYLSAVRTADWIESWYSRIRRNRTSSEIHMGLLERLPRSWKVPSGKFQLRKSLD